MSWAEDDSYPEDVHAMQEPGQRSPAADESAGRLAPEQMNKARYRLYPGGQDEQELKVQESLPLPTRLPDGSPVSTMSERSAQDD